MIIIIIICKAHIVSIRAESEAPSDQSEKYVTEFISKTEISLFSTFLLSTFHFCPYSHSIQYTELFPYLPGLRQQCVSADYSGSGVRDPEASLPRGLKRAVKATEQKTDRASAFQAQ